MSYAITTKSKEYYNEIYLLRVHNFNSITDTLDDENKCVDCLIKHKNYEKNLKYYAYIYQNFKKDILLKNKNLTPCKESFYKIIDPKSKLLLKQRIIIKYFLTKSNLKVKIHTMNADLERSFDFITILNNIFYTDTLNKELFRGGLLLFPEKLDSAFIDRPYATHLHKKKLTLGVSCLNLSGNLFKIKCKLMLN